MELHLKERTTPVIAENADVTRLSDDSYSAILRYAIEQRPKDGIGVNEMRHRFRYLDAIDGAPENLMVIQLEKTDAVHLLKLIDECVWGGMSRNLVSLVDALVAMV